jgi:PPOX class probable F420-dependent enzyme
MLDLSKPQDAHTEQRLREDKVLWLGSVRPEGRPHLVPVWFLWDGATILIFSVPEQQKIRNIRNNPNVILALDDTQDGEDVITIEGTAALPVDSVATPELPEYVAKYDKMMRDINLDPKKMANLYSQAIRVTPTRFI